jgi:hypothetical protein
MRFLMNGTSQSFRRICPSMDWSVTWMTFTGPLVCDPSTSFTVTVPRQVEQPDLELWGAGGAQVSIDDRPYLLRSGGVEIGHDHDLLVVQNP